MTTTEAVRLRDAASPAGEDAVGVWVALHAPAGRPGELIAVHAHRDGSGRAVYVTTRPGGIREVRVADGPADAAPAPAGRRNARETPPPAQRVAPALPFAPHIVRMPTELEQAKQLIRQMSARERAELRGWLDSQANTAG
jgi:hypothetical protein